MANTNPTQSAAETTQHKFYVLLSLAGVLPVQSRTAARELQSLGVSRLLRVTYKPEIDNYLLSTNKGCYYFRRSDVDLPFLNMRFERPVEA